ncbi:MAG TPA: insulinase family protein, partial [Candidatus Anammoximicrobium sp.]|nr:insulinase family protein [Candidatus Anammoximicrobium sp.]
MTHAAGIRIVVLATSVAVMVVMARNVPGREMHVAKTGNDQNPGSLENPFLTIGKAAAVAQPGDTVTVHAGTYREWVQPARSGGDENSRIVYRAAAGEEVLVKGSEQITSWVHEGDGVSSSRLYQALVKEQQLFSNIECHHFGSTENGLVAVEGKLVKGVKIEDAEKAVMAELEKIKTTLVSEQELQKVKNKTES